MNFWPHQVRAVEETLAARRHGLRRILVTTPTGGGKTKEMLELARLELEGGGKVSLYSNRRLLTEQTSGVLMDAGMYHGVRAAGYEDELDHPFQVTSIQTEHSRVIKRKHWEMHDSSLVLVDEAHAQTGPSVREILKRHREAGATIVGFTATPIDLAEMYDHLVIAGTPSELRKCGALVPAYHYGPDEPDLAALKQARKLRGYREGEDLSEKQAVEAMGPRPELFGRIWEWFEKLNPEHRPTICFAPDVAASVWIAEQFTKNGVRAAHIDGQDIWIDGELHRSNRDLRQEMLNESRNGKVAVLCNRFVLREGIDAPWLAHGIFATIFGSLQSYLQSGGRLLRNHDSLEFVTVQDHGGNWWKHGSLNADRDWQLEYTASMVYGMRAEKLRKKQEREPARCPQCGMICTFFVCKCGYEFKGKVKSRPVVSMDGTLKEMKGDIFRPRTICRNPDGPAIWEKMYWRSRSTKGARTFRQAFALFAQENRWQWPNQSWPFMPTNLGDEFRLVKDVPMERLTKKAGAA